MKVTLQASFSDERKSRCYRVLYPLIGDFFENYFTRVHEKNEVFTTFRVYTFEIMLKHRRKTFCVNIKLQCISVGSVRRYNFFEDSFMTC